MDFMLPMSHSLFGSLAEMLFPEHVRIDCRRCKRATNASKYAMFRTTDLPLLLKFTVLRFQADAGGYRKNCSALEMPFALDLWGLQWVGRHLG